MFIETVPNRNSSPAVLLRESYRDDHGRSQKRTLANLSKLPGDIIDSLKALLKGATVIGTGPGELEVERSLPHGHVAELFPGERLIVCRNRDLAAERARKREDLLAATERALARVEALIRRRNSPLRSAAEIGLAVGAVVNSRKVAKHFAIDIGERHLSFKRRNDRIIEEARLDGIYVLPTSVPAQHRD